MKLSELQELEARWVMQTYARMPVEFVRGEGAWLWDSEGVRYLDFLAGISVCSVGHCHPDVVEAVRVQVGILTHTSNLYLTEGGVRLAERLCESSLGGRAFLCNSGTEANECAIKLVRKHAHGRGISNPEIVVLEGAFHGRTMGSLSATPGLTTDDGFRPYLQGFPAVPRDNVDALRAAVGDQTAAIMLEPIQGETGVHVIPDEMIVAARELCDATGALLVFDEIQTGMGRTGSLWAYEQLPVRPDVMTTAKALGGGLPVGACVTSLETADVLERGDHGSTFAGGPWSPPPPWPPLACSTTPSCCGGCGTWGAAQRWTGGNRCHRRGPRTRTDARRPAARRRGQGSRLEGSRGGPDRQPDR